MISPDELEAAKKTIGEATQGKWIYSTCYGVATIETSEREPKYIAHAVDYLTPDNATFMVTFQPSFALRLIEMVETLQKNDVFTLIHERENAIAEAARYKAAIEDAAKLEESGESRMRIRARLQAALATEGKG